VLPNGCALKGDCRRPRPGEQVDAKGCAVDSSFILRGVKFEFDSARLTAEAKAILDRVSQTLTAYPDIDVELEGHTDNIPIRTERFFSNWDLSAARAAAVANVLLARDQVSPERLRVTGLADTRPRVANTTADNRAKNRRVEIIIDLSGPLEEQEIRLRELIEAEQQSQEAIIDLRSEQASPSGDLVW